MSITWKGLSCQGTEKGLVFQGPQSIPKMHQSHLSIYLNYLDIYLNIKKAFKHI
jgi:hypothetical protein